MAAISSGREAKMNSDLAFHIHQPMTNNQEHLLASRRNHAKILSSKEELIGRGE